MLGFAEKRGRVYIEGARRYGERRLLMVREPRALNMCCVRSDCITGNLTKRSLFGFLWLRLDVDHSRRPTVFRRSNTGLSDVDGERLNASDRSHSGSAY